MSAPIGAAGRGALTPAVAAAAGFALLAALASVAFVTIRGGLQLPASAASASPVAYGSALPPTGAPGTEAPATPGPTSTAAATASPVPLPTDGPTGAPSPAATPSGPRDPILALPGCPDRPGCFVYTVRRGDSYTAVSDRFGVPLWIMAALNPEVTDTRLIVVGQSLYLGRDPTVRLEPCPDGTCHLYAIRSGDTLSEIAGRYGLSVAGIEAINPGLDPAFIVTGQVIRLPLYRAP